MGKEKIIEHLLKFYHKLPLLFIFLMIGIVVGFLSAKWVVNRQIHEAIKLERALYQGTIYNIQVNAELNKK